MVSSVLNNLHIKQINPYQKSTQSILTSICFCFLDPPLRLPDDELLLLREDLFRPAASRVVMVTFDEDERDEVDALLLFSTFAILAILESCCFLRGELLTVVLWDDSRLCGFFITRWVEEGLTNVSSTASSLSNLCDE